MSHLYLGQARTRALAAMLRNLHGPVLFRQFGEAAALHVMASRLVIVAGDQMVALDQQQLKATAARERIDVVGVSVDAWKPLHPILFDIYLHRPDGVAHLPACRLFSDGQRALFVLRFGGTEVVRIGASGLIRTDLKLDPVARIGGIGRAQAELATVIWGRAVLGSLGRDLHDDDRPR